MTKEKTLKNSIAELLQTELNQAYYEITRSNVKMFKVETNWYYEENNFKQYDEATEKVIVDQYNRNVKYIPVAIQSIVGQRVEIPNVYINDIIVPVSMLIFDTKNLDMIEVVLSHFSSKNVGKVHTLEVLTEDNETESYKFTFTMDLPDMDEFVQFQGENAKIAVFQLSGTLTQGSIKYGNDISYYLSIDKGATYEEIIKIEPSSARKIFASSDQLINKFENRAVEQNTNWSMTTNILVFEDSIFNYLVPYADERDYRKQGYQVDYLDQLKLKIVHKVNNKDIEIIKDVIIENMAYSAEYGEYLVLTINFLDKLVDEDIPLI